MSPPVVAAIDCGTNSTRLLVNRGGAETLERLMTITRLGEGVDHTGRLASGAIERTLDCLRRYREVMDGHGVEAVRITATSAARDAANRDELFDTAEAVVGTRPELLSGLAEGQLSFRGATAELDPAKGPFLVVDLGGRLHRAERRHHRLRGGHVVGCGLRSTHREVPAQRPSASRGAAYLHFGDRRSPRRRRPGNACGPTGPDIRGASSAGTISTAAAVEQGLHEFFSQSTTGTRFTTSS